MAGGGEWVLVGAKRRNHKSRSESQQRRRDPSRPHSHGQKRAGRVDVEPFDADERVSETKQRDIQARVERISAALVAQMATSRASEALSVSMIESALRATSLHLQWKHDEPRRLHVVSYGLGSFCSSSNAVYQLAFVHALVQATKQRFGELVDVVLEIFDPVMNASDREIAAAFDIVTIDANESGKRVAATPTVFFMPHCGHALYHNVIAANFTASTLHNTLIIGNSFEAYSDRLLDSRARKDSVLLGMLPYVTESALPLGIPSVHDEFSLYESAFNDLSIHTFSPEQAEVAHGSATLRDLVASSRTGEEAIAIDRELIV